MQNYLDLGHRILVDGYDHPDRTGTGRRSLFGQTLRFKLQQGFPLVTTREMPFRSIVEETLWFIRGSTQSHELQAKDVHFWDHWAVKERHIDSFIRQYLIPFFGHQTDLEIIEQTCKARLMEYLGSIGTLYGKVWRSLPTNEHIARLNTFLPLTEEQKIAPDKRRQWQNDYQSEQKQPSTPPYAEYVHQRACNEVDQMQQLINGLKERPWSARHVISAWIPEYLPFEDIAPAHNVLLGRGALSPCHVYQQYVVSPPEASNGPLRLSLHLTQRSADVPIGLPSNIAQYSLLLSMIAQCVGMVPHEFHWCGVDVHIYANQIERFCTQLQRTPLTSPLLHLNPDITDLYAFTADDIQLEGYESLPSITYPIAV